MERQSLPSKNRGGKLSRGMIVAYSGTVSNGHPVDEDNIEIADWHVCDGTNGTPDLRGRFILGESTIHKRGTTGGEETHMLSVEEMPSHMHVSPWGDQFSKDKANDYGWKELGFTIGDYNLNHKGANSADADNPLVNTRATGGSKAHNNMPPYYVLTYIMKLN